MKPIILAETANMDHLEWLRLRQKGIGGSDAAAIAGLNKYKSPIQVYYEKVEGVKLLDVDPGMTTNRTVITFVGEPEPVCEAAYRVVKKAAELIDMSQHHGAHPRQGATDVCPLIPVSNITM